MTIAVFFILLLTDLCRVRQANISWLINQAWLTSLHSVAYHTSHSHLLPSVLSQYIILVLCETALLLFHHEDFSNHFLSAMFLSILGENTKHYATYKEHRVRVLSMTIDVLQLDGCRFDHSFPQSHVNMLLGKSLYPESTNLCI